MIFFFTKDNNHVYAVESEGILSSEILKKLIGADVNNSSISAIVDDLSKKGGDKYYGN